MNNAKQYYEEIIKFIKPIYSSSHDKYQTESAYDLLAKFDIAMQYSLIQIALIDLRWNEKSYQFIKEIFKYGDIVKFLNSKGYYYDFDTIGDSDCTNLIHDLDEVRDEFGDYIASFASLLSVLLPTILKGQQIFDLFVADIKCIFIEYLLYIEASDEELLNEIKDTPIYFALTFIAKNGKLDLCWIVDN